MKQGAGILFTDWKAILLLKRAPDDQDGDTWGIPGGGSLDDETPHQTAVRETQEECGIKKVPGTQFDIFDQKYPTFHWTTFLYAVPNQFDLKKLSEEHSSWSWFELENLPNVDLHPKLRPQIESYLKSIRKKFGSKFEEWARYSSILENLSYNSKDNE